MTTCKHEYQFSRYCGCMVCVECSDHKGLGQCYCGWTIHGGPPDFDEPVDPEPDIPFYNYDLLG